MQADAAMARAVRLEPDSPEIIRLLGAYVYQAIAIPPRHRAVLKR